MNYFRAKVSSPIIQNGIFETGKGNLFEYIEAAKFNVDATAKGSKLIACFELNETFLKKLVKNIL